MQPKYKITLRQRKGQRTTKYSQKECFKKHLNLTYKIKSQLQKGGEINIYNLTFAKTLDVASVSQALLISRKSFTKSGSIYKSTNSLFLLPHGKAGNSVEHFKCSAVKS